MSAQKALQGSETETGELLEGTEGKSVALLRWSLIYPLGKSVTFLQKGNRKKLSYWPDLPFLQRSSKAATKDSPEVEEDFFTAPGRLDFMPGVLRGVPVKRQIKGFHLVYFQRCTLHSMDIFD